MEGTAENDAHTATFYLAFACFSWATDAILQARFPRCIRGRRGGPHPFLIRQDRAPFKGGVCPSRRRGTAPPFVDNVTPARFQPAEQHAGVRSIGTGRQMALSSPLVRGRLEEAALANEALRRVLAVLGAIEEEARRAHGTDSLWWVPALPLDPVYLAELSGLPGTETVRGIEDALAAAVLLEDGSGAVLSADLIVPLPALAAIEWEGARRAIRAASGRLAPSLAVLREVARLDGQRALSTDVLARETGYGRSAVADAVAVLHRAGLVERQASGKAFHIRLRSAPAGHAPPEHAPPTAPPRSALARRTVVIGRTPIDLDDSVPRGTIRTLSDGTTELHLGALVLRVDAQGNESANLGSFRLDGL